MKSQGRFFIKTVALATAGALCLAFIANADEPIQYGRAAVSRTVTQAAAQAPQSIEHREESIDNRAERTAVAPGVSRNAVVTRTATTSQAVPQQSAAAPQVSAPVVARTPLHQGSGGQAVARSAAVSRAAGVQAQGAGSAMGRAAFHENDKGVVNQEASLRRAGIILRPTVAEVGGRGNVAGTGQPTTSNIGNTGRIATRTDRAGTQVTSVSINELTDKLSAMGDLTAACHEQYTECMDQFCNVLDANQKRCSCSDRLSNYSRVENATKEANNELNEVAQRIRYVGLTADEIRAILSATEAELALTGARDTTENRNMLDQIEQLIKNPESFVAASGTTGYGLDMNIDFALSGDPAEMFNIGNLFGTGGGTFANMRGTQLLNAARGRCENVLSACRRSGVNVSQITARYEIEIDRDCTQYEKGLEKMNQTLRTNVRAATQMLQQARLAVMQNHNQYDAKGCVGALEKCMTDDMVCGRDFVKCIDPTKMYIDENGTVVLGKDITNITGMTAGFNMADMSLEGLPVPGQCSSTALTDGTCIINFLLQKIGTSQDATSGLCRATMDRCRAVTYDKSGKFNPHNEVVKTFIQRAMVNIKAAQSRVISDFATTCMQDVAFCYSQQVSQVGAWSSNASAEHVYNVMRGACRNVALTCGYAVFSAETNRNDQNVFINGISEIFYQSMLCPDNSTFATGGTAISANGTSNGWVNAMCKCDSSFMVMNGSCVSYEECNAVNNQQLGGTGGAIPGMQYCRCAPGYSWKAEEGGTTMQCRQ
ncbi:MAG: hypothetical protein FWG39_00665 [Alphaproteobacteria bacterium]|nr:hypothetical protein [Alphaproteobacteria bacterium]